MNSAGRRIMWAGGVVLVILGAFVWLRAERAGDAPPSIALAPSEAATSKEEQPKPIGDNDQDGLANWEEALRQTNPNNPDSDGDGTSDKDELEAGRDPLKKGPDDVMQSAFALQLPPPRVEMLPTRAPIRQEARPESSPPTPPPSSVPSAAAEIPEARAANPGLRAFGNALGAALALVTNDAFAQNEQTLIAQAVPSRDGAALPALAQLAQSYERVASNLQAVAAPAEGTALLSTLKDGYARLGRALTELSKGGGAELKIISEHWTEYSASVIAVGKALNEAIGFFMERGVRFAPGEAGSIFAIP